MEAQKDTVGIGPAQYAAWHASAIGATTDAIEERLVFELLGEVAGRRVLDAGCGDGTLACVLAARGAEVIGIDADEEMIAAARRRAYDACLPVRFLEGHVEQLPFPEASFDIVVSVTLLCFVSKPVVALREMARVLRPGGRLVIGELGRRSLWAAVRRVRGWLGSPTWKTVRFRTASELRALTEQAGLSVTAVRGAVFYPPMGILARIIAPLDPWVGRLTTFGAAFIALRADSVGGHGRV